MTRWANSSLTREQIVLFSPTYPICLGIDNGKEHRFRLLVRRGMFELYIDDMLMQTYVYKPGSGKVGFLAHNANVIFMDVQAWNMSP